MSEPIRSSPSTPIPTTSSSSARGRWPCCGEAGCAVTIATMTPGDCGSAEHDAEAIADDPPGRGPGLGRPDRRGLSLPGVPRPGDLQRRRVAAAGDRGPAPARPDIILTAPPADYICDHEMTSLLVRDACFARPDPELRDPAVGARAAAGADPAPLLRRSPRGARPRRPARAGRLPRRRLGASSRPSGGCSPATPASATGCSASTASTNTSTARRNGAPSRGAEIGVAHAEAFRQYRGHPYPHDNELLRPSGRTGTGESARSPRPRDGCADDPEPSVTARSRREHARRHAESAGEGAA